MESVFLALHVLTKQETVCQTKSNNVTVFKLNVLYRYPSVFIQCYQITRATCSLPLLLKKFHCEWRVVAQCFALCE